MGVSFFFFASFPAKIATRRFGCVPAEDPVDVLRRLFRSFVVEVVEEPREDALAGRFGAVPGEFDEGTAGMGFEAGDDRADVSAAGVSKRFGAKSIWWEVSFAFSLAVGGEKTLANPLRRLSAKRYCPFWNYRTDWNSKNRTKTMRALSSSCSGTNRLRKE